jgi:hypothetical protein
MREPSPWPFIFAGLSGARSHRLDHRRRPEFTDWDVEGREWTGHTLTTRNSVAADELPEWSVLRLWLQQPAKCFAALQPCGEHGRIPEDLARQAATIAKLRFEGIDGAEIIPDPAGAFRAQTVEWAQDPLYLGTVLLLHRPR